MAKLQPCFKVHGIDDEVTVYMVGIAVGGDENLRTGPCAGGKLQGNFMCLPVGDILRGREGLDMLVEVDAVHLAMSCLGCFELQNGIHPIAVDTAD